MHESEPQLSIIETLTQLDLAVVGAYEKAMRKLGDGPIRADLAALKAQYVDHMHLLSGILKAERVRGPYGRALLQAWLANSMKALAAERPHGIAQLRLDTMSLGSKRRAAPRRDRKHSH